jgi:dipeptidyl aminopeptidase/acylaminoacyl peptidase
VATDGKYVIGDFNDMNTPPQLFVYQPGQKQVGVFARLDPQFEELTLAHSEEVHWKTSTGFDASGLLLVPPSYIKGVKYPLVIQTKPFSTGFVCSFGNFPSFVPQPLASSGIMYLGSIETKGSTQRAEDYFPKGYPGYQGVGGVAEAAFEMDFWDSAVKALDERGLIDSSNVGIIGFSRTGWYTEFILAHSKLHYRAATVADNVQYSLGEYWLSHDAGSFKTYDLTYGGPPYGATLKNWLDYSVSFNLDKIHTPLLMEEMGYGTPYDRVDAPPMGLAQSFEVFSGLNRLGKPVELYYYPNEDHTPAHPQARLATMQRNVDWYRFWLQGYEDPDSTKREQYARWRELRKLQDENDAKAKAPGAK